MLLWSMQSFCWSTLKIIVSSAYNNGSLPNLTLKVAEIKEIVNSYDISLLQSSKFLLFLAPIFQGCIEKKHKLKLNY